MHLLHIPYLPGALVLALVFTDPGTLLGGFLDTLSLKKALSVTLWTQTTSSVWQVIAAEISYTALENRGERGLGVALHVGVVHAQDNGAAIVAGVEPIQDEGARAADVQKSRGTPSRTTPR